MNLLDNKNIMEQIYKKYPRKETYPNEYYDGLHNCFDNSIVIYCNSDIDIRRCNLCGDEWECRCNFDENFN